MYKVGFKAAPNLIKLRYCDDVPSMNKKLHQTTTLDVNHQSYMSQSMRSITTGNNDSQHISNDFWVKKG